MKTSTRKNLGAVVVLASLLTVLLLYISGVPLLSVPELRTRYLRQRRSDVLLPGPALAVGSGLHLGVSRNCIRLATAKAAKITAVMPPPNKRAGGDGGRTVLFHGGRAWLAAPQHGR